MVIGILAAIGAVNLGRAVFNAADKKRNPHLYDPDYVPDNVIRLEDSTAYQAGLKVRQAATRMGERLAAGVDAALAPRPVQSDTDFLPDAAEYAMGHRDGAAYGLAESAGTADPVLAWDHLAGTSKSFRQGFHDGRKEASR